MTASDNPRFDLAERLILGAAAGLAGGVVSGIELAALGRLPLLANLVGSGSPVIGAAAHLAMCSVSGIVFSLLAYGMFRRMRSLVALGVVYGLLLGELGPVVLQGSTAPLFSLDWSIGLLLAGHAVFGAALALTLSLLHRHTLRKPLGVKEKDLSL
ncbi:MULTISPECIES: hypothetical protein [Amycolatopsis]|nr:MULTISPECIES: hypothetical protein [Amycolatopsis]MYW97925.1 hypothetical protein [Amycolatopsis rubida]OAP24948.1 hypothetical protein A4R44_04463 [Amycolatopsis sp. M39]